MTQQLRALLILLIKFKLKEGTHKTLFQVISELNGIAPIDVNGAEDHVGTYEDSDWVNNLKSGVI